jgi:hypothetical protein
MVLMILCLAVDNPFCSSRLFNRSLSLLRQARSFFLALRFNGRLSWGGLCLRRKADMHRCFILCVICIAATMGATCRRSQIISVTWQREQQVKRVWRQ